MTDDAMFQMIKNGRRGGDGKTLIKVVREFKP